MLSILSIVVGNEQIALVKVNEEQQNLLEWLKSHSVLKEEASFYECDIEELY